MRELERQREEAHAHKQAKIRAGEEASEPQPTKMKIWKGTQREFGDHILKLFASGKIKARSKTNALEQACRKYSLPDGRRMKAKSIMNSLYAKDHVEK